MRSSSNSKVNAAVPNFGAAVFYFQGTLMNRFAWSMSTALLLCANFATAAPVKPAAIVDGHVIPMDEIVLTSVRQDRDYVVDQMIQAFVIDRESQRRKIVVSNKEIDARVAEFAKGVAPATVDATLKLHQMSMSELRDAFRVAIERDRLTAGAVKPTRMVHCRQVHLRCSPDGAPKSATGAKYTPDEAKALLEAVAAKVESGGDFGALAGQYGDKDTVDLGVLYDRMLNVDAPVLEAGLKLKAGQITREPVKTSDGYCLIQAVSTSAHHPLAENGLYKAAVVAYRKTQAMFLQPKIVGDLIAKCKITYAKDTDLVDGRPLPKVAAVVDGHPIPMSTVARKCVTNVGHTAVNIAVENYVVDRECKRRGITASDAEIDAQVDTLRKRIVPETIEEGLRAHHQTMAGLRHDFRQQIERSKLVMETIAVPAMAHALVIFARSEDPGPEAHPSVFTKDAAELKLEGVLAQFDHGAPFDVLAQRNSDLPNGGDIGIVFDGVRGVDTAMVQSALSTAPGDTSHVPMQTYGGWFLLKTVSTSQYHPASEDAAYASAAQAYRDAQAEMLAPQYVNNLVAKSKVVNYLP